MKKGFIEQWKEYVDKWNKEKFPDAEPRDFASNETQAEIKDFIIRSINDYVDLKKIKFPIQRNYSSVGMSEVERLTYLVEESEKVVFPDESFRVMASIIYDEYNMEHGPEGLLDILAYYVDWTDTKEAAKTEYA